MTLADDVTLDDLIMAKDDLSGADIKVSNWMCLLPVRETADARGLSVGCEVILA